MSLLCQNSWAPLKTRLDLLRILRNRGARRVFNKSINTNDLLKTSQIKIKADFYAKLYIALKEASETEYWLELLHESGYIGEEEFSAIYQDCQEIIKILVAITKHRRNG